MNDADFMKNLLDEYGGSGRFGHREHLHMSWSYVRRCGMPGARERVFEFLRHVTSAHDAPEKLNVTLTHFWVAAVARTVSQEEPAVSFETMLDRHPHLADRELPYRHWSRQRLLEAGRECWVEPDLVPLPPELEPSG